MKREISELVIDVNIWVKWAANNRIGAWLEAFGEFGIDLFGNSMLLEEMKDVMSRPFFTKLSGNQIDIDVVVQELSEVITMLEYEKISFNCPDPDDEYLIEAAFKSNSILVTNDKLLLEWKQSPIKSISLEELRARMNELLPQI
jgi:putative PIN family toxin of toxin-antitoxin system